LLSLFSNTFSEKPKVWAIANGHPGNTAQIVGLADALGWDYEIKNLRFSRRAKIRRYFMISYLFPLFGLDRKNSSPIGPPWPDVVIGVGRYPAPEIPNSDLMAQFKKFYTRHAHAHFSKINKRSFGVRLVDAACAWFMRLGGLIPGRDMNILHNALYSSGRAYPFGEPLVTGACQPLRAAEDVARWIKNVITTC